MKKRTKKITVRDEVIGAVPMNWLDPLLTGPDAVISSRPTLREVENLLRAVRDRQTAIFDRHEKGKSAAP